MPTPTYNKCKSQFQTSENLISHLSLSTSSATGYRCYSYMSSDPVANSLRIHLRTEHLIKVLLLFSTISNKIFLSE